MFEVKLHLAFVLLAWFAMDSGLFLLAVVVVTIADLVLHR